MSEQFKSGKTVVGDFLRGGIPKGQLCIISTGPLDPEALAKRREAKAEMFAKKMAEESPIILDEAHHFEKKQNSSLCGAYVPGGDPLFQNSKKIQNASLSGEHYEKLPHTVSIAQECADGTATGVTSTYSIGARNLSRRYRSLYNQASLRKKLYLKAISKTHSLEECIKHAKRIKF